MVYQLAQENVCFLSRPRRFGKSLLLSTLEAYFRGKKDLFRGLKIEKLEKSWNVYPVLKIDFAGGNYKNPGALTAKLDSYLSDWEKIYGKDDSKKEPGDRFEYVLKKAYESSQKRVVVLIDEYDKPMLDCIGEEAENTNRDILRGFYGTFKPADEYLQFVLLTGVTKFSQISVFSGLNQMNDISMDKNYDTLCGITEEELTTVFAESTAQLACEMNCTIEVMKKTLKKQYDGYHFSEKLRTTYNPFSLMNAFHKLRIGDFWYSTGTPSYLMKLLDGNNVNMQRLLSRSYDPSYFMDYRAAIEDPLAMFYQSGYLTIKGYDPRYNMYNLDYPNDEVRKGFVTLVANSYLGKNAFDSRNWIIDLDRMLRRCDLDGIRDAYTSFLASIPYEANKDIRTMDYESHLQYTFYIIHRLLSCYTILIEKQNSKGRSDIIIESDNDIYLFVFELNGSAKEALLQIEEKQYALPYLNDPRKVHRIGVNISSKTRTVAEWLYI